ncbi:Archaeal/vacuolar-type H+-ATPase subunit C [Candidatus Methanoplasma termitum]|uniref:A-type ATP synthase subunit C n=1 Tax=Candidatus Methanoplasma termitum TaxID=1577791 RepID=A0A0A7LFS5_9ARCH|nr:ATP synthase A1 subunit C [Candidatus Methanoplasma termitum]AIZ57092.1 Archaeal/vacuolar-type H+-ATPase subunit C [Candidatus Methanoplasma termitum]
MFRRSAKKGNYAYTVARVKAKKSLLLGEEDYNKMLMMTVPEISRYISETGYGKEMADLAGRMAGMDLLEHATHLNMANVFSSILRSSTGELYDMVSAYLEKWDIWNLKVILRGKSYGLNADGIREDLVPAGILGAESLDKLIALETDDDVISNFGKMTRMSFPQEVLAAYKASGNLGEIEDFLEKTHYVRLINNINPASRPSRLFLEYIKEEVDMKNFETILKLKSEGIYGEQVMKYIISGGRRIDDRLLTTLANAEDVNTMMSEVSQLEFSEAIKEALEAKDLTAVVSSLRRFELNKAKKFSHLYPLSVIPVVDFMIHKELEIKNIRAIARGTESGLDRETIKGLLVI